MNGCVIPHTPIAVDFWKVRACPQARVFFLTHLHGDHVTGLTSSWNSPIYCSEVTEQLLLQRYGIKSELIHSLQIGEPEIVYLDEVQQEQMTVTALDANHCPGAVMFLMEGYFGTILHTGDFRYQPGMVHDTVLNKHVGKIDVLYLDNTYCSPRCTFPTREEVTANVINIIESHPNHDILIAMRNLGKETLLSEVALHSKEWIYVPDKFYKTLEIIGAPNVFDCNSSAHRIRVVEFYKVSKKFVERENERGPTIVIMPTAIYTGIDAKPYENLDSVFVVPYSDHSSYTELIEFVSLIRPNQIIPVVKAAARGPFGMNISDRADMSCFKKFIGDNWNRTVQVPMSVQAYMANRNFRATHMDTQKGLKRKSKCNAPSISSKKVKRGVIYDSPKGKCASFASDGQSTDTNKENKMVCANDSEQLELEKLSAKKVLYTGSVKRIGKCDASVSDIDDIESEVYTVKDSSLPPQAKENFNTKENEKQNKDDKSICEKMYFEMPESQGFDFHNQSSGFEEIHAVLDTTCNASVATEKIKDGTSLKGTPQKTRSAKDLLAKENETAFDKMIGCKTYPGSQKKKSSAKICENTTGVEKVADWLISSTEHMGGYVEMTNSVENGKSPEVFLTPAQTPVAHCVNNPDDWKSALESPAQEDGEKIIMKDKLNENKKPDECSGSVEKSYGVNEKENSNEESQSLFVNEHTMGNIGTGRHPRGALQSWSTRSQSVGNKVKPSSVSDYVRKLSFQSNSDKNCSKVHRKSNISDSQEITDKNIFDSNDVRIIETSNEKSKLDRTEKSKGSLKVDKGKSKACGRQKDSVVENDILTSVEEPVVHISQSSNISKISESTLSPNIVLSSEAREAYQKGAKGDVIVVDPEGRNRCNPKSVGLDTFLLMDDSNDDDFVVAVENCEKGNNQKLKAVEQTDIRESEDIDITDQSIDTMDIDSLKSNPSWCQKCELDILITVLTRETELRNKVKYAKAQLCDPKSFIVKGIRKH
ncbi:5' exonuclease Apollo-like [Mya arenaria]|uniref:5' exonuclease Apollo-like n=1 Tax=Mya arenaria TaxID=6604 RepID=UPI0022E3F355|nr:5' exonuclease Apollo-like [Mya arenaria]XP_052779915.1 5' exonuclease Apollo-like [Mya arenaria]